MREACSRNTASIAGCASTQSSQSETSPAIGSPWRVMRALRNGASALLSSMGVHPLSVINALRYRRRGGAIDRRRRTRGLAPLNQEGRHHA